MSSTFADFLAAYPRITFTSIYVGKRTTDKWQHFAWRCSFAVAGMHYDFDYKCGLAHASKPLPGRAEGTPTKPKAAEVLASLVVDAQGASESFEDWCESYGYCTDSRQAEKTYNQCRECATKLAGLFGRELMAEVYTCMDE